MLTAKILNFIINTLFLINISYISSIQNQFYDETIEFGAWLSDYKLI